MGEAHPGRGVIEAVLNQLKPLLLGKDPRDVEPLYHQMLKAPINRSGTILSAIGGVETALWDVTGKAMGVPAYRLLGGKYRERIPLYADVGRGETNTPEAWAKRAQEGVADGYQAIKFDIDGSADELRQDAVNRELNLAELAKMTSLIAAVREAAGDGIDVCVDCHGIYSTHAAILLAERLEPFNLMFLEDPVPNDNVEAMAKVTASTSIPICTGEYLHRRDGFRELIQEQACDMLHVDVSGNRRDVGGEENRRHGGPLLHAFCSSQYHVISGADRICPRLRSGAESIRYGTALPCRSSVVAMGPGEV